jgi:hypothetical protein
MKLYYYSSHRCLVVVFLYRSYIYSIQQKLINFKVYMNICYCFLGAFVIHLKLLTFGIFTDVHCTTINFFHEIVHKWLCMKFQCNKVSVV